MTPETFVKMCLASAEKKGKKSQKEEKIPSGLVEAKKSSSAKVGNVPVTHPVSGGKKHPKIGCAWDAMGPWAGSGEHGPFDGLADGEGAGIGEGTPAPAPASDGGTCCGEAISGKQFNACLEQMEAMYPDSNVVPQIKRMFQDMQTGGDGKFYCSADGCDAGSNDCCVSDDDAKISAAAASVEAALSTFKRVAGYDYPGIRN